MTNLSSSTTNNIPSERIVVPKISLMDEINALNSRPRTPASAKLVAEPLAADLCVTYSLNIGTSHIAVSPSVLQMHKLSMPELRQLAFDYIYQKMGTLEVCSDSVIFQITTEDNMAACCILLNDLWQTIEKEIQSEIVACVVHRDKVLYTHASNLESIAYLEDTVDALSFGDDANELSKQLILFTGDGWIDFFGD